MNLAVVELDREFWGADLEPMPLDVWRKRQQTMAEESRWIMDGDLGPFDDPAPRLRRADTVVVLDMPFWLCAWRALRRGHEQRDLVASPGVVYGVKACWSEGPPLATTTASISEVLRKTN